MPFKSIVRELKEIGSRKERRPDPPPELRRPERRRRQGRWAELPEELLRDVMERVEAAEESWPARRDVVACASVCRSWRNTTMEIVRTPEECARITFPISLKQEFVQPGPRDGPIQCFVKRERATGIFRLYLGLSPASQGENEKLLLAARKIRRATNTDYMISLVSNDFSRSSSTYVGKLRSNFLGTKFTIYDSQPPTNIQALPKSRSFKRLNTRKVSPRVPCGNYNIATICYELNVLRTRGPRRVLCTMQSIPNSAVQEGGTAPTPISFTHSLEDQFSALSFSTHEDPKPKFSDLSGELRPVRMVREPLVLKNKAPRWHEQLQCWCLNFKGRVTVASVKNFQLVAAGDPSQPNSSAEDERVILQFGKIGKDIFTMDYQYPLSAFQAFALCLSSFDTKPACE